MGTGGWVTPRRTEIVQESERTRVTRLFYPDRTLIRKEPLGPDAERRLEHETAVLAGLRGVPGLAQLARAPRYPGSVLMIDAGRVNLAGPVKPLAADDLSWLALRLARALANLHDREVIHRDIRPAHVVLSDDGEPCLVGFSRATSFAEARLASASGYAIAAAMAYPAPELTGRAGRAVDQRADLCGLGATLYELATGEPPSGYGPASRLRPDHLAPTPAPPAEVVPGVPASLSAIIMQLLEKDPDDRYQSANDAARDLERLRGPRAGQRAAATRVGEHDVPVPLAPSRLAGREAEVADLRDAFAAALAGQCRGVLISGAPGVGKTALGDDLRPAVAGSGGWFVTGTFDQCRRDAEFDATRQAFRALGRLLLAEPEDEFATVRLRILAAVGPNAGLLAAVVPEFAALLRVPPDPGDPLTTQERAQPTAARALRAIASKERPVLMFLDDLQWAGSTPLGFVDLMLSERATEGLLLVAAYRPSDVDAAHPLATRLSRWRGQPAVRHLRLASLDRPGLVTMIAGMLRSGQAQAAALAPAIEDGLLVLEPGAIDLLGILSASQALSSETSVERLHARVTEVLAAMTGATGVRLVLWDEERQSWLRAQYGDIDAVPADNGGEPELPMSVLRYLRRTREPLTVADTTTDDRFAGDPYFADVGCCSLLAMPILGHGALQAALLLENRLIRAAFTAARLETVELIAGQLAVSLRNVQLYAENRRIADELAASRARVIAAADQARRRIERDLHDGAQQRLVALALQLRQAQAAVPPGLAGLAAELDRAVTAANSALDEVGEIARGVHPAILTSGGLRPAVRALAHRSPVPTRLHECTDRRLPEYVEVTAYYVIAEALANATKHARAAAVSIRAEAAGEVLVVTIRDDGIGGADPARGTGLTGLKDRVEALGGVIRIESPPGAGTMLRAELPLIGDARAVRDDRYAQ
jgi:signal transduction histidine kinase